jgi:hypothetical protein
VFSHSRSWIADGSEQDAPSIPPDRSYVDKASRNRTVGLWHHLRGACRAAGAQALKQA